MLKVRLLIIIFFIFSFGGFCQKTQNILKTDFAVRDFNLMQDNLLYLEKRELHILNTNNKKSDSIFIGGYGLKLFCLAQDSTIVIASNEMPRTVSGIRFYNTQKKKLNPTFFYTEGRMLDFILIPENEMFAFSSTNKKILVYSYVNGADAFNKIVQIDLDKLSRKLIYKNKKLYFSTDNEGIYCYNFIDNDKSLLIKLKNDIITDFVIEEKAGYIIYATISGKLIKRYLFLNKKEEHVFSNNFINIIYNDEDKIVCGSWNGDICIFDKESFKKFVTKEFHKRTILSIKKIGDNSYLSSSLDKTIKRWSL